MASIAWSNSSFVISAPLKAQRPKLYHSFDLIADGASLKNVRKDPARIAA
jgi:hypothetical protein